LLRIVWTALVRSTISASARGVLSMAFRKLWFVAILAAVFGIVPLSATSFFFTTGNVDGRLASLSQPATSAKVETETADDFILSETTVIRGATLTGLVVANAALPSIENVEVEIYRVFPNDSRPPSGNVPTRMNSPSDVEVDFATRDASRGTLTFAAALQNASFSVQNSVVTGINKAPGNVTHGEGPVTGAEVVITVTFDPPIILPSDHYFFRPEVSVNGGDFLFLSASRPIVSPGTPFLPDLQAWIRNSTLKPDWLRIGTDIVDGGSAPTFNMTFSVSGETIPEAGTPGAPNCQGETASALARQFGGVDHAAAALGFSTVAGLQEVVRDFCGR
jgi:hypothetical protein